MIEGVKAALDFPYTDGRARYVVFLTDGYIGNEQQIFTEVAARLDRARVFSLGVGSSPNRHLLDGLARSGRGAATYVENHESPAEAVATFYRRLAFPVLTDLEIDWGDLDVEDVVPARIPDLFAGQPVVVYGKMAGPRSGTATLVGRVGERRVEIPIKVEVSNARRTQGPGSMWARRRIQELEDSVIADPGQAPVVAEQVTEIALAHSLMSQYTSFVAIDESRVVDSGTGPVRVDVPVDAPQGMSAAGVGDHAVYEFADEGEDMDMSAPAMSSPEPEYDAEPTALRSRGGMRSVQRKRFERDDSEVARRRLARVAGRKRREWKRCFTAAAKRGRPLARLELQVQVDEHGNVVGIDESGIGDEQLAACLEAEVTGWTVRHGAGYTVSVTLSLDPT